MGTITEATTSAWAIKACRRTISIPSHGHPRARAVPGGASADREVSDLDDDRLPFRRPSDAAQRAMRSTKPAWAVLPVLAPSALPSRYKD